MGGGASSTFGIQTIPDLRIFDRPRFAESSHTNPQIVGVASVRYTPEAATQMLVSRLNWAAAFDPKRPSAFSKCGSAPVLFGTTQASPEMILKILKTVYLP
jgi:hypothetical protein